MSSAVIVASIGESVRMAGPSPTWVKRSPHSSVEVSRDRGGVVGEFLFAGGVLQPLGERDVAMVKHSVVDILLRREIRIERLGSHADPGAEIAQREPGQPVLSDHLPRRGHDLRLSFLTSFGTPVDVRFS